MLKVIKARFNDLTKSEQDNQPNNGSGKENANYLKLYHGCGDVSIFSDAMESEDASFNRSLNWVKSAIEDAYKAGRTDG